MPNDSKYLNNSYVLLDHLSVGAIVIDNKFVVQHWNTRMEFWTEISRDKILGTKITDRFPHLDEPKFSSRIEHIFLGAPPAVFSSLLHKYMIPVRGKDGIFQNQNTTISSIPVSENELHALFIIEDVTDLNYRIKNFRSMRDKALKEIEERKVVEKELKKTAKIADDANKLKDKFISLVSHDLRGPLSSMVGFLDLALSNKAEKIDGQNKEYIRGAVEAGKHMLTIIKDLLNIGRIKTGKIIPDSVFNDANFYALKSISDYGAIANKKGVKLVNEIPQHTRIFADPNFFNEILNNIVGNAIKFCKQGDFINLKVIDGNELILAIEDTGTGISPYLIDKIFNYEEKTSTLGTSGEVGTGLGLPLCKDLLEAHGGSIRVESTVGEGTCFYINLPKVKPKLLIVDDQKIARLSISAVLESFDIDLFETSNGEEALKIINSTQLDLVITDIVMPDMDGFELLKEIRKNHSIEKLPVIMLTSDTNMETREKAFRFGASDFTTKSSEFHDFIPRVRRVIY